MSRSIIDRNTACGAARKLAALGLIFYLSVAADRSAEAGIVHTTFDVNNLPTVQAFAPPTSYDLNVDGVHFLFSGTNNVFLNTGTLTISAAPGSSAGGVFATGSSVIALAADTVIDGSLNVSGGTFATVSRTIGTSDYKDYGFSGFVDQGYQYIGIRFTLGDGTHYGWVQVNNTVGYSAGDGITQQSLTIKDFAYETTAGASIKAGQTYSPPVSAVPEPASLVQLAMGAGGVGALAAMQRRRRADINAA